MKYAIVLVLFVTSSLAFAQTKATKDEKTKQELTQIGADVTKQTRFTDVFVWRDGRWQIAAGHSSRIRK